MTANKYRTLGGIDESMVMIAQFHEHTKNC